MGRSTHSWRVAQAGDCGRPTNRRQVLVPQPRRASGQTWTTFLQNHFGQMVSVDFLTVPTLSFHVLDVFVVLSHARRQIRHFNVTATPSARWTAQQLREAFPFTRHPNTSCGTVTAFMDWNSSTWHKLWRLRNSGLRPVRPGSRRRWNGSSVRSAVSAWTTSSC